MHIHTRIPVDAPASAAWHVLGERFGEIADWASAITHSSMNEAPAVGAHRTCTTPGVGGMGPMDIVEELTEYDPSTYRLTYRVRSGMPRVIRSARNAWQVHALDTQTSLITSDGTLELAWYAAPAIPLLRYRLKRDVQLLADELSTHIQAYAQGKRAA